MKEKLGEPIAAEEIVGEISDYFKIRYGLSGRVIAATGDNPSSFAGLNIGPSDICLSMGTSDTVMMAMKNPSPQVRDSRIRTGRTVCQIGSGHRKFKILELTEATVEL